MTFKPNICTHCGNTTEYEDNIDRGKTIALIKLYNFVQHKGINVVNIDLETKSIMSQSERNNVRKLQHWGLLIAIEETGCYAITGKATAFLKGEITVPKTMIIEKNGKKELNSYRWGNKEAYVKDLLKKENPYWEGDFIRYGEIVK